MLPVPRVESVVDVPPRPMTGSGTFDHANPSPTEPSWFRSKPQTHRLPSAAKDALRSVTAEDPGQKYRDAVKRCGGTVYTRVLARLLELALVVPAMEQWIKSLRTDTPYFMEETLPQHADGMGLTEAARGSLGHWVSIRKGKIANYQIIAPTSWNFSPRDAEGVPGALEAALVGAEVRPGEETPVAVQHIVRSFDPCMVCTVH